MRRHWVLVVGAAFAAALLLTVGAQTTNGQTPPPEESVCDVLIGGTEGLYALCEVYCDTDACDEGADDDSSDECEPPSRRILKKYRYLMQPGDPDMPCLAGTCPCFTAEQLASFATPYFVCDRASDGNALTQIVSFDAEALENVAEVTLGLSSTCKLYLAGNLAASFSLNEAEVVACQAIIQQAQDQPGACPEPDPGP